MKILIIGGGVMGATYAQSFLRNHVVSRSDMHILERYADRIAWLNQQELGMLHTEPDTCVPLADLIILAVKPQDAPQVFAQLRTFTESQQVVLSIMAGVRIETIQHGLGVSKVIRAMPNLPAQIGQGMTVYTGTDSVTRLELVMVQNLLNTTGKAIYVAHEQSIDAATAISGSGPAYVYYFMEALIQSARDMGFGQSEAELLVAQTFRGAVEVYNQSAYSCGEWISRVASKGGTTEAALQVFDNQIVAEHIRAGAFAALHRAIELGKA
jgi:pyrroline-5-carboxylate reductase